MVDLVVAVYWLLHQHLEQVEKHQVVHSQEHQVPLLQVDGVMMVEQVLQDQVMQVALVVAAVQVVLVLMDQVHRVVMVELDTNCQQHLEILDLLQDQLVVD
jgi:hypothetical protein